MPNELTAGGAGQNGLVHVRNAADDDRIRLYGENGAVELRDANGRTVLLSGENASVNVGENDKAGRIDVRNSDNQVTITHAGEDGSINLRSITLRDPNGEWTIGLNGSNGDIIIGRSGQAGRIDVRDGAGQRAITLDGSNTTASVGGPSGNGVLHVKDGRDVELISLLGADGSITLRSPAGWTIGLNGNTGDIYVGGNGQGGNIDVRNGMGQRSIVLDGDSGRLGVGGSGQSGFIHVRNHAGDERVRLYGENGAVELRDANRRTILLSGDNASVNVGENGKAGTIQVRNSANEITIALDGETGDIRLGNADCAEEFFLAADQTAEHGTVMVLDDNGKICPSLCPYDTRVAGVVSGAGGFKPGIVLDKRQSDSDRRPIALMGKVYCLVTADAAPIRVGDLLTTSDVLGHAMKVLDPNRSFGAVIGKAMAPLASGRGLIPILIALQ